MIMTIFLRKLKELIHLKDNEKVSFWDTNSILLLPVVNVDSVTLINLDFEKYKNLRKNRNPHACNTGEAFVSYGVDINRNYDIAFNSQADRETKINCSEVYKGDLPFSEPETQAVRAIFDVHKSVISAMNFHSYGNLWVRPFNFLTDPKLGLVTKSEYEDSTPNFNLEANEKMYQEFSDKAPIPKGGIVANAVRAVDYPAPGEASDWMLWHKGVFAWSPELGYGTNGVDGKWGDSDAFYPNPDVQTQILKKDFPVIDWFLVNHTPENLSVEIKEDLEYAFIDVEVKGYGNLLETDLYIFLDMEKLGDYVKLREEMKEIFKSFKKIWTRDFCCGGYCRKD